MEVKKVFVVGGATNYARWITDHELVDNIEDAQIVLFTGGEDVDPSLYGCEKHPTTHSNIDRDLREKEIFNKIDPKKQIALGICRGSQFLCVMNGGILAQNISGHAIGYTHQIDLYLERGGENCYRVDITSTHHQMQYPWTIDPDHFCILGFPTSRLSMDYSGDKIRQVPTEPEVVKYTVPNKPISLAIQGHPEMMRDSAPVINILNRLLERCLKELPLEM